MAWNGPPPDYRDDELDLVDDYDPELDLFDDLCDRDEDRAHRHGTPDTPSPQNHLKLYL